VTTLRALHCQKVGQQLRSIQEYNNQRLRGSTVALIGYNKNALNHGKEIQAKSQSSISERDDQDERQGSPVAQVGG
jgi:hypothetical protein